MAKTPIIPPLSKEEHFEQELGAYNYIPNDEDDGTGENFPHQKASHDEDDNESMDAMDVSEGKEKRRFSIWTVLLVVICIVLIAMIGYIGWKAYDYYHIPAYETGNISDDVEEPVSTPSILIPSSNSSESDSEPEPTPKPAYSKNTVGYLTVPGVDVTDEPILQHPTDDDYYLTHNEFDRESIWGAYFVPSEWNVSNVDDMYRVTVIFGHSNGNSMHKKFSVLKYFRDVNFAKEHRYIYLTLGEQQTRWKIFAVADYPIDPSYSSDKGSGSDSKNADGTSETDAKPNGSKSDEGKSDKDTKAEGGKDGKNTSAEPKKMTAKEAEKIKKEIDDISQKVPSSDNNDCTDSSCKTSSIFNSNNVGTDAKNNAGENVRQQSKQEVGKNPQDKEIRNIPGGSGLPEKSAYDDVTSIVSDMQRTAAEAKTEKQREKDLREEAAELTDKYKNMLAQQKRPDIGYFNQKARFLDGIGSISITRVVTPPVGAESVYQAVAGVVKSVSRPTQREIIKAIKDKRNGYKLTGLTMGRRVEASLIHHNDGKCFSKSKSPEDVPELCVGVLLDQSESTMGEIINYERLLALTIEDMCRSIEIPAIINGYSGGGGTVRIISYVEPNSVDRKNALRLTSMRADGGTPTAEALAYMLNRLEKRSEPSKILFVVTDGNSNNKAYLPMLLAEAKRNHIMVIAAGIGACRQRIHSEFPENFLDISDMNSMPRNICNIIKRKLVN